MCGCSADGSRDQSGEKWVERCTTRRIHCQPAYIYRPSGCRLCSAQRPASDQQATIRPETPRRVDADCCKGPMIIQLVPKGVSRNVDDMRGASSASTVHCGRSNKQAARDDCKDGSRPRKGGGGVPSVWKASVDMLDILCREGLGSWYQAIASYAPPWVGAGW